MEYGIQLMAWRQSSATGVPYIFLSQYPDSLFPKSMSSALMMGIASIAPWSRAYTENVQIIDQSIETYAVDLKVTTFDTFTMLILLFGNEKWEKQIIKTIREPRRLRLLGWR